MSTENQQSLRIFTIISQIEQALESAPRPKLGGGGRRMVDVDEIFDLLGDLKVTIPEDIRRANSVLIEADTLLEHANQEAVDIVEQAQKEGEDMQRQSVAGAAQMRLMAEEEFEARVSEDKVLLEVQRRAEILQQHAERNAQVVYNGAKQYADDILQDVQHFLHNYQQMVAQNRAELDISTGRQPTYGSEQPLQQTANTLAQQTANTSAQQTAQTAEKPVQPASAKAAQPARPVEPKPPRMDDTDPEEEYEPRRGIFGWFRRKDEDLFEEEDEAGAFRENETPKSRRRMKRDKADDLDVDLDE